MQLSSFADPPKKDAKPAAAAETPKKEEAKAAPKKEEAKKGATEPSKEAKGEKKEVAKPEKMGIPHSPPESHGLSKKDANKKKEKEALDGDSEHLYDGLHMPADKATPEGPVRCESTEGEGPPDPTKPPKKRVYNPEE